MSCPQQAPAMTVPRRVRECKTWPPFPKLRQAVSGSGIFRKLATLPREAKLSKAKPWQTSRLRIMPHRSIFSCMLLLGTLKIVCDVERLPEVICTRATSAQSAGPSAWLLANGRAIGQRQSCARRRSLGCNLLSSIGVRGRAGLVPCVRVAKFGPKRIACASVLMLAAHLCQETALTWAGGDVADVLTNSTASASNARTRWCKRR